MHVGGLRGAMRVGGRGGLGGAMHVGGFRVSMLVGSAGVRRCDACCGVGGCCSC